MFVIAVVQALDLERLSSVCSCSSRWATTGHSRTAGSSISTGFFDWRDSINGRQHLGWCGDSRGTATCGRMPHLESDWNVLDDFVDFLAKQWSESPDPLHPIDIPDIKRAIEPASVPSGCAYRPWHWYTITSHPCWGAWKAGGHGTCSLALQRPARDSAWWCASLGEASQHYSWTPSPNGTFVSLSAGLRIAMKASKVQDAATFCHRILDWVASREGQTTRPDVGSMAKNPPEP